MQQADHERAGAGEWVDDVNVLVSQAGVELVAQHVFHAPDDEIDHLNRRVDDAEPDMHVLEGVFEKLLVQLEHHLLPALGVVDAGGAIAHAGVKLVKRGSLLLQRLTLKRGQHLLH